MNIGDRVRVLSGNEEGIITKFLPNNMVEVAIEDGFELPFSVRDLVSISNLEAEYFKDPQQAAPRLTSPSPKPKKPVQRAMKGIYLMIVPFNDQVYEVQIGNNTDLQIAASLGQAYDGAYEGKYLGLIAPRSAAKAYKLNMEQFEQWGRFSCQVLYQVENAASPLLPLSREFRLKAPHFFKAKTKDAPIIGGVAHVFQLDQGNAQITEPDRESPPTAEEIRESMLNAQKNEAVTKDSPTVSSQAVTVDLHIEHLRKDYLEIPKHEILNIQLETFEKKLDKAILDGADEVTFIHGAGAGTLRRNIQKRLSKHPHVAFFEDAQKEKFGYGATHAKLK